MPIRAQLFDGTILEFPDGTSPDVINSTAKRMTDEVRSAKPPERTAGDIAKDIGITALKGAVGLPQAIAGIADIPTGGAVSRGLESVGVRFGEAQKALEGMYSPAQKAAFERVQKAEGFIPTAVAAIQNPSVPLAIAGQSIPQMLGGAGIARQLMARGVSPLVGAAAGEGAIGAGAAAAEMREASPEGQLSAKQALAALGSGVVTGALGVAGGKAARALGLDDIDTLIARGGAGAGEAAAAKTGFLKAVVGSGLAEGVLEEMPQSAQEQMWQNWSADKPLLEGVPEAAALGAVVGTGFGAVGGAAGRYARQAAPEQTEFERRRAEIEGRAPAPTPFDEASPLENPYGNIPAADLGDIATRINQARSKRKQSPLQSFSVEDIVNAGLPAEQTDQLLSGALTRAGFDPNQTVEPQDILDAAKERGIDTEQPGFRDFLRRSSGAETPAEMTPVQRVAAFGAIQSLPEGVDSLPTGTNAQNFTEPQYKAGLKAIKGAVSGGSSRDGLISAIQKTGVENIQDAQSILQAAIKDGQVGAVSIPSFTVLDDFGRPARVYENRQQAEQLANRLNGQVQETSLTKFVSPELAGADIRPGTYAPEPAGFEIKVGDTTLASAPTIEEVEQKADRFQQIRQRLSASKRSQADQMQAEITQNRESLEGLEATGQAGTKDYAKLQKQVQTKNKKLEADRGRLLTEAKTLDEPLRIGYAQPKRISPEGFTRFEGGLPVEQVVAPVAPVAPAATDAAAIDALQKKLMPALKRFGLENIGLRVVKKIEDGGAGADGAYANLLIQVALSADNPMGVMRHEVIHAMKELGAFTAKEWRVLESKAKSEWIDRFIRGAGTYERYQDVYQQNTGSLEGFDEYIAEEAIAEAFKYFDATKPPPGLVGNLFGRIRNFFSSLRNALQGAGFQTAEEVLGRIEEGRVTPTRAEAPAAEPRIREMERRLGIPRAGAKKTPKFSLEPRILSNGNIVGAPPGARTVEARNELVRRMTNLLSHPYSLYDDSKDWYERSGATIREITRSNPELTERTVRLMALYSQANSLGANTTATIKSIAQLASGDRTAFAGRFPNTTAERIPALLAAPTMDTSIPGVDDKLMNFYRNLHDATYGVDTFQDASTVDRWMMRLFGYPHSEDQDVGGATGVSSTQYIYAKDLIRRISDANRDRSGEELKPRQVQAVLWTYVKNTTDYNSLDPEKQVNFEPSIVDFSDYITRATANITWESRPSTKLPLIPGIHKASRAAQEDFNRAVREIFVDPDTGTDKIFELLGNQQLYSSQFSIGAYENLIAPNVITKLVLQKDDVDYLTDVANKYAAIIGYVTKQDAVPWYRADPTASGKDASKGYRVTATNAEASPEFEERLFKHLNKEIPGVGFTRVGNSFDFINFRDVDSGKPYMMPDKQYLDKMQGALSSFDKDVEFDVEPFRAKSGWISNDWTENPNGQGYLERFSPAELANIRRDIEGWSKDYDSIAEQYGEEYGWAKFSLAKEQRAAGEPASGKRVTTDTIEVDGEDRPTRTSNGTLIFPTEEGVINFWRWFGNSVFVDEDGRPLVMYHGTAADIEEFIPKQANSIFITPDSNFAARYFGGVLTGASSWSEEWMFEHYDEILSPEQIESAKLEALKNIDPETKKDYRLSKTAHHSAFVETAEFNQAIKDRLPSRANVIPLFVKAENPFNYSNENHVRQVVDRLFLDFDVDLEQDPNGTIRFMNESTSMADRNYSEAEIYKMLNNGYWPLIEQPEVQDVIRELGFDGFSVQESLVKNFGVFNPNQVKSAVGNDGNFSDKKNIRFSIAQSKTPQFKQWFGDSKIVDRNGNPLMMYHATTVPEDQEDIFSVFNRSDDGKLGQGIYTTALSKYAESFAPQGSVMPLWVSIQNPLYIDLSQAMQRGRSPRDILRAQMAGREAAREVDYLRLDSNGAKEISDRLNAEIKAINGKRLMDMSGAAIRRTLQRAGYDGIVVRDADGNFVEVNAFEPTQIKSATGNRGTFSRSNKDIRYSLAQTKTPEFKRWSRNAPMVMAEDALNYDFQTGKPFVAQTYHGTNAEEDFTTFDLEKGGYQTASESAGMGIFSTSEPEVSGSYAKNIGFGRYLGLALKGSQDLKDDTEVKRLQGKLKAAEQETNKAYNDAVDDALKYLVKNGIAKPDRPELNREMAQIMWESLPGADERKAKIDAADQKVFEAGRELSDYITDYEATKIPQRIMPLYVRMKNPKVYDVKGKTPEDFPLSERIAEAKKAGHDGVVFKNIADPSPIAVHYVNFNPVDIKSAIGNRGTFDPTNPDIRYSFEKDIKGKAGLGQAAVDEIKRTTAKRDEEGFIQRFISAISPDSAEKFRALYIQKYQALERNTKAVADRFGESRLLADQSAIAAALMSHRASGIAGQSYISGVPVYEKGYTRVDDLGGKVKGLIPIFEPLMKYNDPFVFQAFQFYGATRRGARLFKEGREKLLTPQDIRFGKLLEKEYPEFKQVFDEYQKYNRGLVKFLVDTGVLTEEMGRKWTMYADYIPFYRQADGEETLGPKLFHNLSGIQPSKKLKGGTFKLDDFVETVIRNTKSAVEQGMKNVAAQRAVNEAMMLNTPGQFDYAKRLPPGAAGGPDIVNVREKGVDVKYEVADPAWIDAMKGLYIQKPFEEILKIAGFPTRMYRNIVTKMPDYMLAQLVRDSAGAWVTSGEKFTPIIDTFAQAGKNLSKTSPEVELLRLAGVGTGYEFAGDVISSVDEFKKQLRKMSGKRTVTENVMLPLSSAWELLEKGSNLSDISTRAAVAKRVMEETGNEAEAVFRAIEVMNFDRMGASPLVHVMSALLPFFHSRVQGLDLLYRAGRGRLAQSNRKAAHKAFVIRAVTLIGLSVMYWALASDTDDYKKANEETRDNNWIIGPVKIPIPYEIGVLFKVIPERILGYFFGTDTGKDLKDSLYRQISSTFGIAPPQFILPVWENTIDYSFFTARPIIPKGMEDVAPQFQKTSTTSLTAQKIGEATGTSPIKIDNLISGYFGALGTYTALAIDSMIRTTSDPVKPSMRLDQMPVIRRFLNATEAQGTVGAFNDLKEVVEEVTRTSNLLQNSGRYDQYAAYMKENGKLIEVKPLVQHIDKYMTALRERERQIMSLTEKDISADAKQKALESIRESRNNLTAKIRELRKQISQD